MPPESWTPWTPSSPTARPKDFSSAASRTSPAMCELRILNVLESLGRAGAEQALLNVLPPLRARGHVVELAVLWPPYALKDEFETRGVRVHCLNLSHRWNLAQGVVRLGR